MNNQIPSGNLPDPRVPEDRACDHLHEDLYAGLPAQWIDKTDSTKWILTSQRGQDGSFSCVMQALSSSIETVIKRSISAAGYKLRKNFPGQGMYNQDAGDIWYNIGGYFESTVPSQNMNDAQMDSIELPKEVEVKITGYRTFINFKNINSIAEAIQAYGQCVISFASNQSEWDHENCTPLYNGSTPDFQHDVCAQDFGLFHGVKGLLVRDSAGPWSSPRGYRIITADYLAERGVGAIYILGAKIIAPIQIKETIVTPNATISTTETLSFWKAFKANLVKMGISWFQK